MYGQGDYCVDIVMCIDATKSMAPIINEVKSNAMSLYEKFFEAMELAGKYIATLRVKIIAFRDYICDSEPMVESEFFELPDQNKDLENFLSGIKACGGGDTPECAFEAIATAINSDWTTSGRKRRHIIVVFSDAPALDLGERADCPGYPKHLPSTFSEFSAWWEGTSQKFYSSYQVKAGRLIAFVPPDESWESCEYLNRCTVAYTSASGCKDVDMARIVRAVSGSFDES